MAIQNLITLILSIFIPIPNYLLKSFLISSVLGLYEKDISLISILPSINESSLFPTSLTSSSSSKTAKTAKRKTKESEEKAKKTAEKRKADALKKREALKATEEK